MTTTTVDTRTGDRHKPRTGNRHRLNPDGTRVSRTYQTQRIIAVDGEGWGTDQHSRQRYMLMVAADEKGYVAHAYSGGHLSTQDALQFIWQLPQGHLTSYFFSYDIAMILRDLPPDKLLALQRRDKREKNAQDEPVLVYWNGWGLDWLHGKFFRITRRDFGAAKSKSRTVYDAFPFHQRSYLNALETMNYDGSIVTPEQEAIIREGKKRRSDTLDMADDERAGIELEYSSWECISLARIQRRVFTLCREAGYPLTSYYGAGSVASSMFKKHGVDKYVPKRGTERPTALAAAIDRAYFGGRFETTGYGHIEHAYSYDIRSAYPAAATLLPCLAPTHSDLVRVPNARSLSAPYPPGVWHVRWRSSGLWGPFPQRRRDGRPYWPSEGENYLYASELNAGIQLADSVEVLDGWQIVTHCKCQPFTWLHDVYARRKELKKAGDGREKILKLGPNALYGKLAQRIGKPRYAEPLWAGMITAQTRAWLLEAIAQNPNAVFSTATDGILSTEPLQLDCTDSLGTWEADEVDSLLIVQPGVWFTYDGREVKRRGMPRIPQQQIAALWFAKYRRGAVAISVTQQKFIGIGAGCQRREQHMIGRWVDEPRLITFNSGKRTGRKVTREGWQQSLPHSGPKKFNEATMSYPYKKAEPPLPNEQPDIAESPFDDVKIDTMPTAVGIILGIDRTIPLIPSEDGD